MSLVERIKALPSFLHQDVIYVDVDEVLKLLKADRDKREALMAHLQPENRPKLQQDDKGAYYDEADVDYYFEELDKHLEGKGAVVCIKLTWLQERYDKNGKELMRIFNTGIDNNRIHELDAEQKLIKELLGAARVHACRYCRKPVEFIEGDYYCRVCDESFAVGYDDKGGENKT